MAVIGERYRSAEQQQAPSSGLRSLHDRIAKKVRGGR